MDKTHIIILALVLGAFIFGMLGGLWAQAFLMPYLASHPWFEGIGFIRDWNERITVVREVREIVIRTDDAAERVVSQSKDTVVGIESRNAARTVTGSGFVVTSDGFILTLASVVPQGYQIWVHIGEEAIRAEVLRRSIEQDLAILKIDRSNLQTASFAPVDSIQLAMPLVMVAKSLEGGELLIIVNKGSLRTIGENYLRTNIFDKTALGGSPIFDLEGRVVGLSTFAPDGRLVAIPSSVIHTFSGF